MQAIVDVSRLAPVDVMQSGQREDGSEAEEMQAAPPQSISALREAKKQSKISAKLEKNLRVEVVSEKASRDQMSSSQAADLK